MWHLKCRDCAYGRPFTMYSQTNTVITLIRLPLLILPLLRKQFEYKVTHRSVPILIDSYEIFFLILKKFIHMRLFILTNEMMELSKCLSFPYNKMLILLLSLLFFAFVEVARND